MEKHQWDASEPRPNEAPPETPKSADGAPHPLPENKTEAVRLAMAAGIASPLEIVRYVQETFGLEMTPAHASTIKGTLKRANGKAGRKPRRKAGRKAGGIQAAPKVAISPPTKGEAGLTTGDLTSLCNLAQRAGGFDALKEFVEILGGMSAVR